MPKWRCNVRRFLIAVSFAVVVGLGSSSKAQAQLSYGYTIPSFGGLEQREGVFGNGINAGTTNFYSPFTGFTSASSGSINSLYAKGSFSSFYSPYTGQVSQSIRAVATPFGPLTYSTYNSPFTGPLVSVRPGNNLSTTNSSNFFNSFIPTNTFPSGTPFSNGMNGNGGWWRHR